MFLGLGEMIRFSFVFWRVMYSLNDKIKVEAVTFKAESLGKAITNRGAIESLGPPPGGMMLAQDCQPKEIRKKVNANNIFELVIFIFPFFFMFSSANIEHHTTLKSK
jgi:hypothetical protein